MIVQSMVLPNEVCTEKELYYRSKEAVWTTDNKIRIRGGTRLSTDTYMNLFDASFWQKYTGICDWEIAITLSGKGEFKLIWKSESNMKAVLAQKFLLSDPKEIKMVFAVDREPASGFFYWEISAETDVCIQEAHYLCGEESRGSY